MCDCTPTITSKYCEFCEPPLTPQQLHISEPVTIAVDRDHLFHLRKLANQGKRPQVVFHLGAKPEEIRQRAHEASVRALEQLEKALTEILGDK